MYIAQDKRDIKINDFFSLEAHTTYFDNEILKKNIVFIKTWLF